MADKNKEEPYWSRIVLRWVKCAQLNAGHDNIDLAACYYNFRCKIKDYYDLQEKTIVEFLRVKFPDFELQLGKENEVPASDAIYVFSLMLYFSCVRHSIPYFQNIGKEFDVAYQHSMKAFLNSFVSENDNKIVINRSFMHKAFQNAKRSATVLSEDACNRRDHSQHGVQMLTSTPIGKLEMKKPSPPTPKSVALEWKVKNLNAMLESARSENITQERQIEQLLQNVKDLQEDKKRYRTKISVLQLKEMCSCTSDSTELPHTINRETEQLQKQLDMNNKLIETLQENISKAKESAKTATERYMAMQKQYAAVQEDNVRMKITIEDLKEELTLRDNMNQNLTEAVNDLRRFIRENHIRGAELMEPLNSSFEYLDKSFKNVTSDDSQCYDSENLASTVVDIKLKEKEHENEALTMKIQELEGNLQDMQRLQKEMLEQHTDRQTEANAKITDLLRSLAESEEHKKQLTHDHDKLNKEMEILICQLKSQKQSQFEERERLQAEMNEKITEFQISSAEARQIQMKLADEIKQKQAEIQDLNRKLDIQLKLQAEMDEKTAEMRQALADAEKDKSQLAEDLKKGKAESEDLVCQLESLKKLQMEERLRFEAEMNKKTAEMQQALADAEKDKSQLTEDLKKGKAESEDLVCQLESLKKLQMEERLRFEAEMNKKTAEMQQALADAEKDKSQLTEDLKKGKAESEDLVCQLESLKKLQMEERLRFEAEVNKKIAEMQQALADAENDKSQFAEDLKKGKAESEDLVCQLESLKKLQMEERLRLEDEMNKKTAEMQQALADAEKDKSQLAEDLKKDKAESEDLVCQLESLKKLQMEERLRLEAEVNKKTAEMQQALADAEKDKSQLTEDLKKGKAESEDLVCQLESLKKLQMEERLRFEAEVNKKIAEMQQALADAENDKSQFAEDLKKGKAESEELVCQLESLKKLQLEERVLLKAAVNKKTAEMQQALADAENDKSQLAEDLKKGKAESEELVCQLESLKKLQMEERLRFEAEMNKKTAEMQQALADAEKDKSQLTEDLKKGKAESEELVCQLESLKKLQMEERLRLEAEVNKKTVEMQQALADAEKDKSQLTEDLKKGKAESEELVCQLESLKKLQMEERLRFEAEVNKNTAEMQQALADAENDKSQLAEDLKKGKAESEELVCQLESLKKLQMEERLCFEAEMNKKTAEMQQALADAEKYKSQFAEDLKKGKAESEELVCQLESQHKLQMEERLRFEAAMNEQISELRQALADAEKDKSQLEIYLQNDKSKREELTCQLMIQKQIHIQECECLRSEMNEKNVDLQRCLAEAQQMKQNLFDELKTEQAKTQDLNRKLDIQLNLQAEMDEKTLKMRQALTDADKDKSQLAEDLKKGKVESEDLVCQLESLKKLQQEERLHLEDEMNKKTAEMQQALADAEKGKSQLADELNRLKCNESFTIALRTEMLEKVSTLQQSLEQEREKSEEINCQYLQAKKQADDLDAQCIKLMQKLSEDRTDISNLQSELTSKDAKLEELKALYDEKQKQFEKNYQDNEILSVKLYKARSALKEKEDAWAKSMQDCKKDMEEKLRDARIEFDSTMEKMKERMKELHKEVKTKLACDNQGLALTADGYRRKVENLEIRCAKLQKQLAEMNERNLDVRKENQHLHIKLKTLEEYGSNLRMEDEEGELFNNMYLADLKSGRCVSPGPTNGGLDRYSELSQRNSKLLPHLRTNYVALAPDCEPPHDDTRDNMSTTFDDSSTGLISRRKVSGITSYKRPGPPTPSKRAGRLSLNGALAMGNGGEIQYKDALRDANTDAATGGGVGTVAETTGSTRLGRTKTPGKFKQMISSSSLLNNFQRDENTSPRRRLSWFNKGKKY
uniref:Uncharacterized protein n=1 Tax=Anopheles funestus TaxID=62324 RepID=A0A182RM28_ANOFN